MKKEDFYKCATARCGIFWEGFEMADREPSLADMCVFVLAEVNAMDGYMADDDPLRYQVWKLKAVAERAIGDGMAVARQISDVVRRMRADQKEKQ